MENTVSSAGRVKTSIEGSSRWVVPSFQEVQAGSWFFHGFPASKVKRQYHKSRNALHHRSSQCSHDDCHFSSIRERPNQTPTLLSHTLILCLCQECGSEMKGNEEEQMHDNSYLGHHRAHRTADRSLVRTSCPWIDRRSWDGRAILCYLVIGFRRAWMSAK